MFQIIATTTTTIYPMHSPILSSPSFRSLKNVMWYKNLKMQILMAVIVLVLILAISMGVCGANFKGCSK